MTIPVEIKEHLEKHIELLISQTQAYRPFVKVAYPNSKNLGEAFYNLIVGNAISVFVNQYAMRMQFPTQSDFEEFGKITAGYKERIEKLF